LLFFVYPLEDYRNNVGTPSIARWKARGPLSIRHNWTVFDICYDWDVINANLSKSALRKGSESIWVQISDGRKRRPPTAVGFSKLEWLPFRVVSKCLQRNERVVWFLSQNTHVTNWQTDRRTDGQTDRENYDSKDCASIAARGVNIVNIPTYPWYSYTWLC